MNNARFLKEFCALSAKVYFRSPFFKKTNIVKL